MTFKEDSDICENIVSLHHGTLYERISFPHWRVDGILCHPYPVLQKETHPFSDRFVLNVLP